MIKGERRIEKRIGLFDHLADRIIIIDGCRVWKLVVVLIAATEWKTNRGSL